MKTLLAMINAGYIEQESHAVGADVAHVVRRKTGRFVILQKELRPSIIIVARENTICAQPAAIGISIGSIVAGWLVYDALCRMLTGRDGLLAALVVVVVMLAGSGLFQVFGARAAFLHVGAIMRTMMVANVAHHIIPGQRRMVADIRAGRAPDPMPGIIGKQRSVHNTYFTLPVLFIMISGHYPMTYSHPLGWLVLGVLMAAGVLIRSTSCCATAASSSGGCRRRAWR